jgi:hypothetical protein
LDEAEDDAKTAAAEDAEYEYMADGAAREAGEVQTLGPATEEQAAELRDGELPDAAGTSETGLRGSMASYLRDPLLLFGNGET